MTQKYLYNSASSLRFICLLAAVMVLGGAMPRAADAVDNFTPNPVVLTLQAGQSATVSKVLHLDALPGAADIVIAIDTTGSMGTAIAQAQAEAIQICNDVKNAIPGARFAVVDFEDYPGMPSGGPGDNPYVLLTPGFVADCTTFAAAIGTMSAIPGEGGDFAEAYNRVFFEAFSDPLLVYNPAAVKFLVVLGDAPPHDANQTAAPACGDRPPTDFGRDGAPGGGDDLPTADVLAGLVANNITLLMIHYSTSGAIPIACFDQLAGATGGQAVETGGAGTLSTQIIQLVTAAAADIDSVDLVVSAGCPLGISFSPAPPYDGFTAPVDIGFTETITAPTLVGNYSCTVTAVVDGTPRAVQDITVTVTPGDPANLDLQPPTATNTVDEQHCVTATVTDAFTNPNPGVTVRFSVTPSVARTPSSGSATTNASGQASFCYTSALPGSDVIHAYADSNGNSVQDPGEPSDTADKTWTLPASTEGCKVTYGGRITADNGDKGTFGGNAQVKDGTAKGQEEYQDHGPAQPMNVHSIDVDALVCTATTASIFGTATIDGAGSFDYRIDLKDLAEPGTGVDTYRIRLSNGYDSGEKTLEGGNVQIHN